jgi:hypothetical protein
METLTICHVCGVPYVIAEGHDCPRLRCTPEVRQVRCTTRGLSPLTTANVSAPVSSHTRALHRESRTPRKVNPMGVTLAPPPALNTEEISRLALALEVNGLGADFCRCQPNDRDTWTAVAEHMEASQHAVASGEASLVPAPRGEDWVGSRRCSECADNHRPGSRGCSCWCHTRGAADTAAALLAAGS